ncbi:mechanosensitive ion channel family protein [Nocardioides bigeumensis]|jgi:small-conductance mechanosensitive channel|uniref:Mechanosensitive ion channel n=1 Tax=Nocardioides bigeumensis TaxID=433657 RepID=A0ABP5K698_9ACTN
MVPWPDFLLRLGVALLVATVGVVVIHVAVRLLARRWSWGGDLLRKTSIPFRLTVASATVLGVVTNTRPEEVAEGGWDVLVLALRLLTIGVGAWLLAAALIFVEDLGLSRYDTGVADNRLARRAKTQGLIIRRLTVAIVVVVAVGAGLYSFPIVRTVGASLLASAGIIGIVAAVAAQSTLANLIAGLQVAFSDAIRLDDVVIVEDEWGWIEEITLSYVVVRLWDDRRLVLPSTYFTKTPFQNWTRHSSELLGAVELDVDWRVDVEALRARLDRVLDGTDLWDGRTKVLQVTDAVAGLVRVRALVTATDAARLFDLRCHVREELVSWLQVHDSDSIPRQRVEMVEHEERRVRTATPTQEQADRPGLFSGDEAGEARAASFRRGEQENAQVDQEQGGPS